MSKLGYIINGCALRKRYSYELVFMGQLQLPKINTQIP